MNDLFDYLSRTPRLVRIHLDNRRWHLDAEVPAEPGWYLIRTDAPIEVLKRQWLWSETYETKGRGEVRRVRNYDIASRALRYSTAIAPFVSLTDVYSGLARNLSARAREHTLSDPGTAALVLSRYAELRDYSWWFGYLTLAEFPHARMNEEVLLHLGEQIWRSMHGWPILCSE